MAEERLQKVLAAAGIASRRASEKLITSGRVRVDGNVVTTLGTKVDPARVSVTVDGQSIRLAEDNVYFRVYKPRGILSDIGGDTGGRRTVAHLLPQGTRRVFPVGRLDLNSEGLVLLTDDGELTNRLTHPRFEHPKTYFVLVAHRPSTDALVHLREGVELESGRTAPARVEIADELPARLILDKGVQRFGAAAADGWKSSPPEKGVWLRIVLREGKKRQIRHMAAAVGISLRRLIRWSIGPLTLEGLEPGMTRELTAGEVYALKQMVGKSSDRRPSGTRHGRTADRSRARRRSSPRNRR
ncbi:MAG: rRNA pseudouridine synthase [Caldilineaceae bacterium SB0661_bin_32]|uniref:Pseudouridine synthase n=1 Tax=Caldilineaceae bacterium SB0661_bin_32 TaxID=2605255 RepID=A0A6B1D1E6_9CHLR|nr:rRNA pseudouridine synthase [Caldilineaceae bacterium SB0661_bin_32]